MPLLTPIFDFYQGIEAMNHRWSKCIQVEDDHNEI